MAEPHLRVIDGDGAIHDIDDGAALLPEDYATLDTLNRKLRREISALKGQITKLTRADPEAHVISEILDYWKTTCGHPRAQIPLDGARAAKVKAMLALYTDEELKAVIEVAARLPYEAYGRRYCEPGDGRTLRDDPEFLFAKETRVEDLLALQGGDCEHEAYRVWLHGECRSKPGLVRALAHLASREPHGRVIASAAVWARREQARGASHTGL